MTNYNWVLQQQLAISTCYSSFPILDMQTMTSEQLVDIPIEIASR